MWFDECVFYQVYSLGFCGAPKINDGFTQSRITSFNAWIPHLIKLNVNAVYFTPVFESDSHGYNTRDYQQIDCRLGTSEDFAKVCNELKKNNIRIVLDGVFNHVGRGFWAFQDVIKNKQNSIYKDWFYIHFDGNSNYDDGFYYEGWEGHFGLVKLNLKNEEVIHYLLESVAKWINEFDIDGLRLDVAYCLDPDFIKRLHHFVYKQKSDFFLVGEIISGEYRRIVNPEMLDSCTNYECFKGIYSSLNDMNLFEIAHSLNRQFSNDPYALYKGLNLLSFVDNHDVSRLASNLKTKEHLPLAYAILCTMPGIPCIYYGSEWGIEGLKQKGSDDNLRPFIDSPQWNDLTTTISKLIQIRINTDVLAWGDFKTLLIMNKHLVYKRTYENKSVYVFINIDEHDVTLNTNQLSLPPNLTNLITKNEINLTQEIVLPKYSFLICQ
ncbi:alpha-amylase family glycosyl hydrolase [Anaerorhabdus furcosa]|uniref:Glycosidase n=1 Tax=Anaerorhabdus furcosa TaxID=118967 RepID=A0A1T4L7B1_9FIRM|nr:alpha-amylase family glycosyl hydrolase [Anaerorhabdus furcosa]SJZ50543.1 Glycosidase [Anaerorhabdus furcosa]